MSNNMTDQELAKAIANAVRGIWPDLIIESDRGCLHFDDNDEWRNGPNWILGRCGTGEFDTWADNDWAAAILLQELAQRQDGAEATWAIRDALKRYDEAKRKGV